MRRLFVLRPEPGASATLELARAIGLDAVAVPLFVIEPVAWTVPNLGAFDALLLTSANAVRQAGAGLRQLRALPVHAIGKPTAAAARGEDLNVVTVGRSDIDELLQVIPPGARLLQLCGKHRRVPAHASQTITSIPVYRARALPAPAGLGALVGEVAAVHSPRAAARLADLLPAAIRATIRIAAISRAAADAAGAGWEMVEAAGKPDDTELLALAARLCQNPDPK